MPPRIAPNFASSFDSFLPEDVRRARDLIDLEFGGQRRDIKQTLEQLRSDLGQRVQETTAFGEGADERLANVFTTLSKRLQENVGRQEQIFGGATGSVESAYDEALRTSQEAAERIQQRLGGTAEQLNLSSALRDPLTRLQAELGSTQAGTAREKAGALSNLETLGAQSQGIAQQAVADSQREGAVTRGDLQRDVASMLAELQFQGQRNIGDTLEELVQLSQQEGPAMRTTLEDVITQRQDRERQNQLDRLASQIQLRTLGLQEKRLGIDQADLQLRRRRLENEIALSNDPLDRLIKQAELRQLMQGDVGDLEGTSGVQTFLDNFTTPLGRNLRQDEKDIAQVTMDRLRSKLSEQNPTPGEAPFIAFELVDETLEEMAQERGIDPSLWRPLVTRMVDIFFGNF